MNNPNLLGQLAATPPVGSGVLLGGMDMVIRLSLLGGMFLGEIITLGLCASVLIQLYREKKQNKREDDNSPSEANQHIGLSLHLGSGLQKLIKAFLYACRFCRAVFHKRGLPPNEKS